MDASHHSIHSWLTYTCTPPTTTLIINQLVEWNYKIIFEAAKKTKRQLEEEVV